MNAIQKKEVFWTDERKQQLRDMCEEDKLTSNEMAEVFGITKNSLIGTKSRMGLTRPENNPMTNRSKCKGSLAYNRKKRQKKLKQIADAKEHGYDLNAPKMPNGAGCRFIIMDPKKRSQHMDIEDIYCSHEREKGSSYCKYHHGVCYISEPKKKRD